MVDTERHQRIYQNIADALFASVPDTGSILLTLVRASPEPGGFLHSITSPEGLPPVLPDDALYDATVALDTLLRDEGGTVQVARFHIEWDDEKEAWKFVSDYTY